MGVFEDLLFLKPLLSKLDTAGADISSDVDYLTKITSLISNVRSMTDLRNESTSQLHNLLLALRGDG